MLTPDEVDKIDSDLTAEKLVGPARIGHLIDTIKELRAAPAPDLWAAAKPAPEGWRAADAEPGTVLLFRKDTSKPWISFICGVDDHAKPGIHGYRWICYNAYLDSDGRLHMISKNDDGIDQVGEKRVLWWVDQK